VLIPEINWHEMGISKIHLNVFIPSPPDLQK